MVIHYDINTCFHVLIFDERVVLTDDDEITIPVSKFRLNPLINLPNTIFITLFIYVR